MKDSNGNTNKVKGTTNNRAIECSLCSPFYLFSSLLLFLFSFFCPNFFPYFCSFDIFSQQGAHNNKHQKI
jgi:hypothetical protein